MDVKCALIWGVTLFGVCPYLGGNLIWGVPLFGVQPYLGITLFGGALIWGVTLFGIGTPVCDLYMRVRMS